MEQSKSKQITEETMAFIENRLTQRLASILSAAMEQAYRSGVGDAFYRARAKTIREKVIPIIMDCLYKAICEELEVE